MTNTVYVPGIKLNPSHPTFRSRLTIIGPNLDYRDNSFIYYLNIIIAMGNYHIKQVIRPMKRSSSGKKFKSDNTPCVDLRRIIT